MSDLSQSLVLSQLSVSKGAQEQAIGTKSGIPSHTPVTLDQLLIPKPASTVIFPVRDASAAQYGLTQGDLLIVDRDARPTDHLLARQIVWSCEIYWRYPAPATRIAMKTAFTQTNSTTARNCVGLV